MVLVVWSLIRLNKGLYSVYADGICNTGNISTPNWMAPTNKDYKIYPERTPCQLYNFASACIVYIELEYTWNQGSAERAHHTCNFSVNLHPACIEKGGIRQVYGIQYIFGKHECVCVQWAKIFQFTCGCCVGVGESNGWLSLNINVRRLCTYDILHDSYPSRLLRIYSETDAPLWVSLVKLKFELSSLLYRLWWIIDLKVGCRWRSQRTF